jgi:hypothetical protein
VRLVSVVGADPGPTSGVCLLDYDLDAPTGDRKPALVTMFQADDEYVLAVLEAVLRDRTDDRVIKRFAGVEAFRSRRSAGSTGKDAETTRQGVMTLTETLQLYGYKVKIRPAGDVKPWATDKRLVAAGMKGSAGIHGKSRDAYDGGRQAIYCARWDAFMKDPLQKETRET